MVAIAFGAHVENRRFARDQATSEYWTRAAPAPAAQRQHRHREERKNALHVEPAGYRLRCDGSTTHRTAKAARARSGSAERKAARLLPRSKRELDAASFGLRWREYCAVHLQEVTTVNHFEIVLNC
jgi:hypothetical protein